MARERRIEFPGAVYHVMARGNRREHIVLDDEDRVSFERTLERLVDEFKFELIAYALMDNHYHFLIRTPLGNLVAGMQWFQNTWTKRFNSRHKLWGRLFGDRYKAKPVGEGEYVGCLVDYIHLNPVRAGLETKMKGIGSYRWSSLGDYLSPPRKRRKWVAADLGLAAQGFADEARGRRNMLDRLERMVDWNEPEQSGSGLPDGQSLHASLSRGWYFGSEALREKLLAMLAAKAPGEGKPARRFDASSGYNGPQSKEEKLAKAEALVKLAEVHWEVVGGDWSQLAKADWRKGLVALLVRRERLAGSPWLSERLNMGVLSAVSRTISQTSQKLIEEKMIQREFDIIEQMYKSLD